MLTLRVANTVGDMVVDQPACLHKGVTDGGADKLKAALF
jgi:hypothetical protein